MTEISEAAKAKAREILPQPFARFTVREVEDALARFISEVSDAAKAAKAFGAGTVLDPFILPEPVDPLEKLLDAVFVDTGDLDVPWFKNRIKRLIRERGLKIVEDKD